MLKIVEMKFGSHLYGTATEKSDLDYKGVFMPTKEQIFLGKIPKSVNLSTNKTNSKNTKEDVDIEFYSLHYFIKLALEGQTVALDMLHAPRNMLVVDSDLWWKLWGLKHKFYTKNLKAFIGYARRQAAKYGIKGSRLNACEEVLGVLKRFEPHRRLQECWEHLPLNDYCFHIGENVNGVLQYQVCGKTLQERQKIGYTIDILQEFYDNYGQRAKDAAENKGIDWKAVSHALRAGYQIIDLMENGTITFPLKQAEFLLAVKQGKLDFMTVVSPMLESIMEICEQYALESELPEKPDHKFWKKFLYNEVKNYVLQS